MNLMLVDDEVFAIQGIIDDVNWERFSFTRVLTANSYSQAINLFMEYEINILICDIEMPYGSGINLVEWVTHHSPDTKCIFLTCHDEFSFARQAIKLECLDYILKPAPTNQIEEVLDKAIRIIAKEQENKQYQDYGKLYIEKFSKDMDEKQEKDALDKVAHYIRENIAEPLSIEELARMVYISADYLTRSFKKKYNKTPVAYIREQRMFLAKEMLIKDEYAVNVIGAKVGYGNYSYFIKSFKEFYGITPREFQQRYRKGKFI